MKPRLESRNIGRYVRLIEDGSLGEVTIDLRHENTRPPWLHISLYVRWLPRQPRWPGAWFGAAGAPLDLLEDVP